MSAASTIVVPRRTTCSPPPAALYVRRRLVVLLGIGVFLLALLLGAGNVLANRGGAPASTPAVRPATPAALHLAGTPYVVQPGDSLWSIASSHHGGASLNDYVDRLIERNGGTSLQIGQLLQLP